MKKMTIVCVALSVIAVGAIAKEISIGQKFITKILQENPAIKSIDKTKIVNSKKFSDGWTGELLEFSITTASGEKDKTTVKVFNNGKYIVQDLVTADGVPFSREITLPMHNDEFIISGDSSSNEKLAIFSDPMCSYCKEHVPALLDESVIKNRAIYFYDFPLSSIHPNSRNVSSCLITAIKKNPDQAVNIIKAVYAARFVNAVENIEDTIKYFNSISKVAPISISDIEAVNAEQHLKNSIEIANGNFVDGTPTVFLNGNRL